MQIRKGRFCTANKDEIKNLKIYICTWNVNAQQPTFDLDSLLNFHDTDPDICVFGLQEINSNPWQRFLDYLFNNPWTNELTYLMNKLGYVRIQETRLVGILLNVFIKRPLVTHVRYSIENWVRLGYYGLWGNKGANICTINIGGVNLCFINAHLSAHEWQKKKRKLEYTAILNTHSESIESNQSVKEDYQFFFGDLNFRIQGLPIENVKDLIKKKEYQKLLINDQLKNSMDNDECFTKFKENEITFPPTYKFDLNSNTYDTSTKKRVPSWCDRILYKTRKSEDFVDCEQLAYNHIPEYDISDHKPVFGLFQVKIGNWENQTQDIVFNKVSNVDSQIEINYQINENVVTHSCDWIAIYKEDFRHTEDYDIYTYPERIIEFESNTLKKDVLDSQLDINTIKMKVVIDAKDLSNGKYSVGYFSYVANQLVALSSSFEIKV